MGTENAGLGELTKKTKHCPIKMDEHFGTTESLFAKMVCSLAVNKQIILPYVDKTTNR